MADVFTPEQRAAVMARVKGRDTTPERKVRAVLTAMGYRYRLQGKGLPGTPDIVFKTRRKAVFVHGCFWHGCPRPGCRGARRPKSNTAYWTAKLDRNKARDAEALAALDAIGWSVFVVWECALKDADALAGVLAAFLGPTRLGAPRRAS